MIFFLFNQHYCTEKQYHISCCSKKNSTLHPTALNNPFTISYCGNNDPCYKWFIVYLKRKHPPAYTTTQCMRQIVFCFCGGEDRKRWDYQSFLHSCKLKGPPLLFPVLCVKIQAKLLKKRDDSLQLSWKAEMMLVISSTITILKFA